ncbi:MAG: TrpB-like pyridoxal-phosphate dependent enzyme, partial [Desulfosarcina sp.]|nr:TrpB-like pyridoxal-phosphate dependent enzyme [Desulfosarcina sp.]MBC2768294.1 TrpB-like pyridoxal-phosphate dependent enzyme [Desulfosarcina sp.]
MKPKSFILAKDEIPRQWYNILADIKMNPPLGPDGQPISPDMLAPVFPMNLIEQEVSSDRWIDIPEPVLDVLSIWRPSPLTRATAFEKALGTPAKIYYKNEGMSPPGSHKPNTAVPQAYYNKVFGAMMETWGGKCIASPSNETKAGRDILEKDPNTPGSLGIAISEAVEAAVSDTSGKTRYSLGSVLNHVMLHQTIIGLEAKKQFDIAGDYPDIIIGCAGGGSNFAGLAFPFVLDKMNGKPIEIYPVEPKACPTMTRAPFAYDHGDTAGYTPLLPMYSLGHNFVPAPIHAGGLRYHGMAPTVSQLINEGLLTPKSVGQMAAYEAGILWARTEGFIPAPETS